jgi:hypothetical protein
MKIPSPHFRLTEEQWKKTAKLSGIPEGADDARHEIEIRIESFHETQASALDRTKPAKICEGLEAVAERISDACSRLSKLVDANTALTSEGRQQLLQALDALRGVPKQLLVARYREVAAAKRGPKAASVYWLVGNLDGIREQFTGKKITRSYKDDLSKEYITYACRIADPDIGDGTIDKAMKARIKRRDRTRRSVD